MSDQQQQPFERPKSRHCTEGVAVRDAFQGATFSFLTVRDGAKNYFDVACFEDGPLDQFRAIKGGAEVKISGYLTKRKVKNSEPARFEIQLVAVKVETRQPQQQPQAAQQAPQQFWQQNPPMHAYAQSGYQQPLYQQPSQQQPPQQQPPAYQPPPKDDDIPF